MQDEHIIYMAAPRLASKNRAKHFKAFIEELTRVHDTCDGDWEQIANVDWVSLFGLYWGYKSFRTASQWTALWTKIRSEMDTPVEGSGYAWWAWFAGAMNWRRQKVRTQNGQGKKRWEALKKSPQKHEAQKARNAEAQRKRRGSKGIPPLDADTLGRCL